MTKHEELFKIDVELAEQIMAEYAKRGLAIPNGAEVEPTDWAYENGVFIKKEINGVSFTKINNMRKGIYIYVRREDRLSIAKYWAGFWKLKEHRKKNK